MTSIGTTPNPYAQYGSAYARAAATPSLAATLSGDGTAGDLSASSTSNAATNLTLSDAARARLAKAPLPDFATVTSDARITLDRLYTVAGVKAPIVDGKTTIDLSTLDRRSLFAISTNNGGKFTPDEQAVAATELKQRFDKALEPSLATTRLTGDYSVSYKAALDYLDGASDEEKATATWASQCAAVLKGVQTTQQDPNTAPSGISGDPVAAALAGTAPPTKSTTRDISSIASDVRAFLDRQKGEAAKSGKELVYDSRRKTGQLADLSSLDNRSLSAISLNQDKKFSTEEIFVAKQELNTRTRLAVLDALKQSQTAGDPRQFSLGILKQYSSMSAEERQAANWTQDFQDAAIKSYKSTSTLLSILNS
ncbi:hypothetical protein [Bradyrhizobium elkanii]|uniref:hypothetical protein n=1 Tax=Bradyrhizobium elkanii TaxID=29448 RepID=UPI00209DD133|nr:hypothetical protein [Bradyrhizobium elkanii]MCP1967734.1 hypothetical protein [Bradyrhizobium elkanii]MCS3524029.1 hypothetical protein [Bradyrhizobium elkanii]MCS4071685.1 hypothetical protein [Bradyrhizobium elkanii]MCS4078317.1 hypothetical protein [Bradyrhizobium elkanii]MCS4110764.1 hypothetical protein [Bradyrhizobium elkanii]